MESTANQWELELQASIKKLNEISLSESSSFSTENETAENLTSIENKTEKSAKNIENDNMKQCVDSQSGKLFLMNYQGWHSLTQSPINSILSKSKDALKNSISKSLSNSPVNMRQFSFGKAKLDRTQSNEKSTTIVKKEKESQNSSKSQIYGSLDFETVKTSSDLQAVKTSSSEDNVDSCNNQTDSRIENVDSNNLSRNLSAVSRTEKSPQHTNVVKVQKVHEHGNNFTTHSLNSSPIKRNFLFASKSSRSLNVESVDQQREFKKSVYSASKELPLLSIFRNSQHMSKDKSCSMIDLGDKQNLKTLFENGSNRNLQTVSVERLANARYKLMCKDKCDLKPEVEKNDMPNRL